MFNGDYVKKTIFAVSLTVFLTIILIYGINSDYIEVFSKNKPMIIIDAGHGAPDGGAVALDGTFESDINLHIALKIHDFLKQKNIECILTRSDSNSIYSKGESIHEKKVSDIKNRVKIANDNKNVFFLSIHMNTYPSPSVSGAQVFYKPKSEVSERVANQVQDVLNLKFQPDNTKKIKPIPSNVYLFNHIENDCVLIECGFLTNQNDLNNLKNEKYQNEISKVISEAVIFSLLGG